MLAFSLMYVMILYICYVFIVDFCNILYENFPAAELVSV